MKFIKVKMRDDPRDIILNVSHIIYFHKCKAYPDCTEIWTTKDLEFIVAEIYIDAFIEKLKSLL